MSRALADSRAALADRWTPAWMEAPVWCFAAAPGLLGTAAAAGLWMPSADRAGRPFPLVIATTGGAPPAWLAAAEDAGRAALAELLEPDALAARIPAAEPATAAGEAGSVWWTDGAPRVAACRRACGDLPGAAAFAAMLDDAA